MNVESYNQRSRPGHFFFYGYSDHRDLHSFPTRRSSDLSQALPRRSSPCSNARNEGRTAARSGLDRKSTRLNSSHGSISYAVVGLIKKKDRLPDGQFILAMSYVEGETL